MHECGPDCGHSSGILIERPPPRKPRLRITTPSIRPENLAIMEKHPEWLRAVELFDFRWQVLIDCFSLNLDPKAVHHVAAHPWQTVENVWLPRPEGQLRHGEDLYNRLMDRTEPDCLLEDEWHMGIADDSLPVAGVFEALRRAIDEGADVVMFPMQMPGSVNCPAEPEHIHPNRVSGGQVAFRRDVAGDLVWIANNATLDGIFLEALWQRTGHAAKWAFLDGPAIRHNQLRGDAVPGGIS